MLKHHQLLLKKGAVMAALALALSPTAYAAKPIDLSQQPVSILNSFLAHPGLTSTNPTAIKQISSDVDIKQTTHIRIQETYAGYPVWGADAIAHIPAGTKASLTGLTANSNASMNGTIYQDLNVDLQKTPASFFTAAQANKALAQAKQLFQKKSGLKQNVLTPDTQLMVFIDKDNKAHWAYLVSFLVKPADATPMKPTYIMDAVSFNVYEEWDNIQTLEDAVGGGFGGNTKMGKLTYDGLEGDLAPLTIQRDATTNTCFLENTDVRVKDVRKNYDIYQFQCEMPDGQHGNIFWNGDLDHVNDAFSPADDALFIGRIVKDMYQKWYNVPVLTKNGKPMVLDMCVHENMENAYWNGSQMTFGDGGTRFYPLVSLGVGAHEVSHGFTEQHSHLVYSGQSGGLNESFSDMAAQAAEFYAYGKNSWEIGPEIFKAQDEALRYMETPSKDCHGGTPGNNCSIDVVKQYKSGLNVHYSSGIFNRFFYLLGTAPGWDTRKAFDVMVEANMHHWTSTTNFSSAACGVLKATKTYGYDVEAVKNAAKTVGIDMRFCFA